MNLSPKRRQRVSRLFAFAWRWRDQIDFTYNAIQLLKDIAAGVVSLLAILGIVGSRSSAPTGKTFSFLMAVADMPLPLRFALLLAVAAAVGWLFGETIRWLSRKRSGGAHVVSLMFCIVTGCVLVLSAEWLAVDADEDGLQQLAVMSLFGTALALWIAATRFTLPGGTAVAQIIVAERAQALVLFTGSIVVVLVLTMSSAR